MRFKNLLLSSAVMLLAFVHSHAQLADGSTAPDFTLTDIDGNTHHLYDYLAQGKIVVLDFSATWCGPCWSYHTSGALENLYNQYGPDGSDQFMVFMIEADLSTDMNDLNGTDPASQGDWIAGTPYPIIDLQSSAVSNAYNIGYFPTIYTICPVDYTVYESGQATTATHATWTQSCTLDAALGQVTDAVCYGDGSASVNISGGLSPFSYQWSNGSSQQDLQDVGGGTYAVTVTEGNGKTSVVDNIVIQGPQADVAITNTLLENNLCFGDMSGQIAVNVTGGTPGYTFEWTSSVDPAFDGNGDDYISQLPAGTYTAEVTDANGCQYVQEYEVSEPPLLEAEILNVSAEACDQVNGIIDFQAIGGTGVATAALDGPSGPMTTTDGQFDGLLAGIYSINIVDENGCEVSLEATIDYIEAPTVEVISDNVLTCTEPVLTLEAAVFGGTGEVEYNWYTFNGNILSFNDLSEVVIDAPGEYFVEVIDLPTGCMAENGILVVSEQDIPDVELTADGTLNCDQSTVLLQASYTSNEPNLELFWTDAEGNIIETGQPEISVDTAGEYLFTLTNTDNGCSTTEAITVIDASEQVVPGFSVQVTELSAYFDNNSTGSVSSWLWDFGDGNTSTEPDPVHIYAEDGIYNVCLTAENACGAESICQEVTVQGDVSAILVNHASVDNLCHGDANGSIEISVIGGTGGYSYQWTGPGGFESTLHNLSGLAAGVYELLITDADGNSATYTVEIFEPEALGIAAFGVVNVTCFGDHDGQVSVTATGGTAPYTYQWSDGYAGELIDQLPAGVYSVTVTDANGCQLGNLSYTVSQPEMLHVDAAFVSELRCAGDSNGEIILDVSGGTGLYSYAWSNGAATDQIGSLHAGSYQVSVTDANGCVFISESYILTEPEPVSLQTTSIVNASGADAADGHIEIGVTGGTPPYAYLWSNGATTGNLLNIEPGIYSVVVTDANGCVFNSPDIELSFSTGTEDILFSRAISIAPNPVRNTAILSWDFEAAHDLTIRIFNTLGKQVGPEIERKGAPNGTLSIDVSGWDAGLYFISVRGNRKVAIKKLMVE